MTKNYTFYKIRYKRHYFAFPVLIALCLLFLTAILDNIVHHQHVILNFILCVFFTLCLYQFTLYFIRLCKIRRPYIRLSLENLEYADIWNKKYIIPFDQISKTDLSSHSFQKNLCIDLNIYSWNYKLQRKSGFGENRLILKIRISPTEYENLSLDFVSLLSILKLQNIQEREHTLEKLNQDKSIQLNQFMSSALQNKYKQDKVILINHSLR
ncbi:hypothetical protein G9F31_01790 [Acinetobacter sp. 187]|uniref:hypothetical protein n=1 Tax=Acinetobacter lanii TaxID=2715163 RepID=UPI0014083C40|nr:hypothetical protein [Acinetobacter lanii]NHC02512.1 hypothetical protein [Acinetobacter lanii]